MKALVLIVMVTVACGHPLPYNTVCETTDVALLGGEHENLGCDRLRFNLAAAKRLLTTEQTWRLGTVQAMRPEDWAREMSTLKIWVGRYIDLDDQGLSGYYDGLTGEVQIGIDQESLLHELLHRLNTNHLQPGTINHENWEKNGYDALSAMYVAEFQKVR